jgi:chromate transport protein ChrA
MSNFLQIIVIALLAETIWENLKMVWQEGKVNVDRIGALIVSVVVSMATQLDIFAILNFGIAIPFIGSFLTGILISRGANVIHDLLNKIEELTAKS